MASIKIRFFFSNSTCETISPLRKRMKKINTFHPYFFLNYIYTPTTSSIANVNFPNGRKRSKCNFIPFNRRYYIRDRNVVPLLLDCQSIDYEIREMYILRDEPIFIRIRESRLVVIHRYDQYVAHKFDRRVSIRHSRSLARKAGDAHVLRFNHSDNS